MKLPRYEVDYWNDRDQTRTAVVDAPTDAIIPFRLHEKDREFKSIKHVRELPEEEAQLSLPLKRNRCGCFGYPNRGRR
jgi:hypothetical protein